MLTSVTWDVTVSGSLTKPSADAAGHQTLTRPRPVRDLWQQHAATTPLPSLTWQPGTLTARALPTATGEPRQGLGGRPRGSEQNRPGTRKATAAPACAVRRGEGGTRRDPHSAVSRDGTWGDVPVPVCASDRLPSAACSALRQGAGPPGCFPLPPQRSGSVSSRDVRASEPPRCGRLSWPGAGGSGRLPQRGPFQRATAASSTRRSGVGAAAVGRAPCICSPGPAHLSEQPSPLPQAPRPLSPPGSQGQGGHSDGTGGPQTFSTLTPT